MSGSVTPTAGASAVRRAWLYLPPRRAASRARCAAVDCFFGTVDSILAGTPTLPAGGSGRKGLLHPRAPEDLIRSYEPSAGAGACRCVRVLGSVFATPYRRLNEHPARDAGRVCLQQDLPLVRQGRGRLQPKVRARSAAQVGPAGAAWHGQIAQRNGEHRPWWCGTVNRRCPRPARPTPPGSASTAWRSSKPSPRSCSSSKNRSTSASPPASPCTISPHDGRGGGRRAQHRPPRHRLGRRRCGRSD